MAACRAGGKFSFYMKHFCLLSVYNTGAETVRAREVCAAAPWGGPWPGGRLGRSGRAFEPARAAHPARSGRIFDKSIWPDGRNREPGTRNQEPGARIEEPGWYLHCVHNGGWWIPQSSALGLSAVSAVSALDAFVSGNRPG